MKRGVLILLLLALFAAPASAHVASLSTARITVDEAEVRLSLSVNSVDVEAAFGPGLSPDEIAARLLPLSRIATTGGEACTPTLAGLRSEGEHLVADSTWDCPPGAPLQYESELWRDLDPQARQLVIIVGPAGEGQALLDSERSTVELDASTGGLGDVAWRFLVSGVEHIFLGYDHIAFLLAVVLWGRRFLPLLKVVTAFTVAHSITLSLAATGALEIPGEIIEPLIALSIVFVAAENFFVRNIDKRWRITFFLGLIHGFGFAGALAEFGLPKDSLLTALATFNLGVELGQVAILCLALPLLLAIERFVLGMRNAMPSPRLVYGLSVPILALGCWWSLERIVLA